MGASLCKDRKNFKKEDAVTHEFEDFYARKKPPFSASPGLQPMRNGVLSQHPPIRAPELPRRVYNVQDDIPITHSESSSVGVFFRELNQGNFQQPAGRKNPPPTSAAANSLLTQPSLKDNSKETTSTQSTFERNFSGVESGPSRNTSKSNSQATQDHKRHGTPREVTGPVSPLVDSIQPSFREDIVRQSAPRDGSKTTSSQDKTPNQTGPLESNQAARSVVTIEHNSANEPKTQSFQGTDMRAQSQATTSSGPNREADMSREAAPQRHDIVLAREHAEGAQTPEEPEEPQPIRWRKGELIGAGAYGRVYMGMDLESGELIAVKQVLIAANHSSKDRAQEYIRGLEDEVAVLRNLSHPNIVRYLGTAREDDALNIFLEFVPGGSIASLLTKFGCFTEKVIRSYTRQLMNGLDYLHANHIMHRDIKGANILVDNKGCIKLADFGASKKLHDLATISEGHRSMKGTPYWMAPEVIKQTGHGRQADIWSVGCTVIEMATGKPPWSEYQTQVAALFHIAQSKEPPQIPDNLSQAAKDFLLLCFRRDPRERPSAAELLQHPFLTTDPVAARGQRKARQSKAELAFQLDHPTATASNGTAHQEKPTNRANQAQAASERSSQPAQEGTGTAHKVPRQSEVSLVGVAEGPGPVRPAGVSGSKAQFQGAEALGTARAAPNKQESFRDSYVVESDKAPTKTWVEQDKAPDKTWAAQDKDPEKVVREAKVPDRTGEQGKSTGVGEEKQEADGGFMSPATGENRRPAAAGDPGHSQGGHKGALVEAPTDSVVTGRWTGGYSEFSDLSVQSDFNPMEEPSQMDYMHGGGAASKPHQSGQHDDDDDDEVTGPLRTMSHSHMDEATGPLGTMPHSHNMDEVTGPIRNMPRSHNLDDGCVDFEPSTSPPIPQFRASRRGSQELDGAGAWAREERPSNEGAVSRRGSQGPEGGAWGREEKPSNEKEVEVQEAGFEARGVKKAAGGGLVLSGGGADFFGGEGSGSIAVGGGSGYLDAKAEASEEIDDVTEEKIRWFLEEKANELKRLQTPLIEELNSLRQTGALPWAYQSHQAQPLPALGLPLPLRPVGKSLAWPAYGTRLSAVSEATNSVDTGHSTQDKNLCGSGNHAAASREPGAGQAGERAGDRAGESWEADSSRPRLSPSADREPARLPSAHPSDDADAYTAPREGRKPWSAGSRGAKEGGGSGAHEGVGSGALDQEGVESQESRKPWSSGGGWTGLESRDFGDAAEPPLQPELVPLQPVLLEGGSPRLNLGAALPLVQSPEAEAEAEADKAPLRVLPWSKGSGQQARANERDPAAEGSIEDILFGEGRESQSSLALQGSPLFRHESGTPGHGMEEGSRQQSWKRQQWEAELQMELASKREEKRKHVSRTSSLSNKQMTGGFT